jgi:hypothetical protein
VRSYACGSLLREFLHVDNFCTACVFVLERWSPAPGDLTVLKVGTSKNQFTLPKAVAEQAGGVADYDDLICDN